MLHQQIFAGDLIPRILPVGIGESSALVYDIAPCRLVICACGADVDILICPACKQPIVTLDLLRHESDKLTDRIKLHIAQLFLNECFVIYICDYRNSTLRQGLCATIYDINLPISFQQQMDDCTAYSSCSTDDQCFHDTTSNKIRKSLRFIFGRTDTICPA